MIQTELLKHIIEKANVIKQEFGSEVLSASHVVAAVADLCKTKYTGFTVSEYGNPRFEEERLRYIFSKEIKLASYFRLRLSINSKNKLCEDEFKLESCEKIMALKNTEILSADIVFLCALKELHNSYKGAVKNISCDKSILKALQDTDKNIYDYVIDNIEKICETLKIKEEEAKKIRDWQPKLKFAEPEEILSILFEKIEKKSEGGVLKLKFKRFFASADLKLSIYKVGEEYCIHDNGCAIKYLSKKINDNKKLERVLKKVCEASLISKGKVIGTFTNAIGFFVYLKMLTFIAHADLYYSNVSSQIYKRDKYFSYKEQPFAEEFDQSELITLLKQGINASYNEDEGLFCWFAAAFSLSYTYTFFLIETLDNGLIRISDRKKHQEEGGIFDNFYWDNDDITPYSSFVLKLCSNFGAEFDGRDIYLTDKKENFARAFFEFFNLAVLLSEFGRKIDLPKIRRKG